MFGRKPRIAGSPSDLLQLARQVGRGAQRPRLYQYCGRRDFLHADNLRFRDAALRAGLDVTYVEDGGDHQWSHWDEQIRRVIAWLPR
jgi:S-formylglutathione hydrolase FrmB